MTKKNNIEPFEKALFLALSENNFLLPTNDEQVTEIEKSFGTTSNAPEAFEDGAKFCIPDDNVRRLSSQLPIDDLYSLRVASPSTNIINTSNDDSDKQDK